MNNFQNLFVTISLIFVYTLLLWETQASYATPSSSYYHYQNEPISSQESLMCHCNYTKILNLLPNFENELPFKGPPGKRGKKGEPGEVIIRQFDNEKIIEVKGEKGSRGKRGPRGLSIEGEKGSKGEPSQLPDFHELFSHSPLFDKFKGEKGEPGNEKYYFGDKGDQGPQGPPGLSITGPPGPPYQKILKLSIEKELKDEFSKSQIGSMAYLQNSDTIFIRIRKGWREITGNGRLITERSSQEAADDVNLSNGVEYKLVDANPYGVDPQVRNVFPHGERDFKRYSNDYYYNSAALHDQPFLREVRKLNGRHYKKRIIN